jgi:hypothetical protein
VELFERVARLFETDLRVPNGNVCRLRCDARFKRPLLPWHVGDLYESDPLRLVLVGRPPRQDEPALPRPAGTLDGRETSEALFRGKRWPFWLHTREILKRVYGSPEAGWRRLVLTSIVKCANSRMAGTTNDTTTRVMKESCLREAGVLREELAVLAPRTVVLFTGGGYDEWLDRLCWEYRQVWTDRGDRRRMVMCGNVPLLWWEASITGGAFPVRVLRVGHPQGRPVEVYAGQVAAWIAGAP